MGESIQNALRLRFDPSLKLEFHGANVTSDISAGRSRRSPEPVRGDSKSDTSVRTSAACRALRLAARWAKEAVFIDFDGRVCHGSGISV